jgi:hypothetical protein
VTFADPARTRIYGGRTPLSSARRSIRTRLTGKCGSDFAKTEIHSASTERLISDSLEELQRLLTDAYNKRNDLRWEASRARAESNDAARRYNERIEGFLYKRLFKDAFVARKEAVDTAAAKVEELEEQLRLTTIATEIHLDT